MKLIRHIPWIIVATLFALVVVAKKAEALTPQPINVADYIQMLKVVVRVTPGNNGQARYWWYKMRIRALDGTDTLACGKYDMSQVLYQTTSVGDETLLNYLSRNYSDVPMSDADKG